MQVTETQKDGLKRGYEIKLTATELDEKVDEKLAEAQPEIQMKGFRKGKVPLALLKKQYGEKLLGEVMQEQIDSAMTKHFEETGDRPAAQPEVKLTNERWQEGDDVHVALNYEALPDIPDAELSQIEVEKLVAKADEASVDEALQSLAESAQDFEAKGADAQAEDGDQVVVDFVGKIDGEAFEGGAAEDYPLTLGSESFIPGFEDQLKGAKAGDELAVTVTFPEDYGAEHLAGKQVVFDTTLKEVKAPRATPIDDDLAKKYGAEDLDDLKRQIREKLEAEYAGAARQVLKRNLLDKLDEAVSFELPPSLVEAEAKQIAHQLWHDANPDVQGHDHPEIEPTDEHRRLGERRVKLGLYLAELGQKNEIEVTDSELTQAIMTQARQYPGQERQFFEYVQNNQQIQQQIRAPLFEDKVIDYILELAQVTEREVSKEELQKAVEALDDTPE